MASDIELVKPGQVISSDLMNRIINKLNALEKTLQGLPAGGGGVTGGPPSIALTFSPSDGQAVGAELTVTGKFDFPPSLNTVVVGDAPPITDFRAGSNLTTLKFLVPASINVPIGTLKTVTVRVVNSQGIGEGQYVLKPQVQATVPAPTINSVSNEDNSNFGATLQTGKKGAINGSNFSTTLANNTVELTIAGVTAAVPTASIVSVSPAGDKLVFVVPADVLNNQGQSVIGGIGSQKNGTLKVTVLGNNVPASHDVTVMKL
ncbi:MAG: hypothetical protein M3444_09625 [Acidobacteriota bacterium]|nr:hypothetical protein [Acidobacteriota bacterium]MDQ5837204.1 hypothetical protein [Acidobacteriota bacterium]